jgi:ribosomal protein S18 acetylase RimI-like enzyme
MDFLVREATEKDYQALNSLFEELDVYHRKALPHVFRKPDGPARTRDFISGIFADKNAVIFIAEIQDQIIGLVHAYIRTIPEIPIRIPCRAGEIDNIVVKREYRRHGVGKALMKMAHQWANRMKLDRLELSVWDFNEEARNFYRAMDYGPAFIRMWKNGPFF